MTDQPVSPQWIDVSQADDLRDVIHRAVACLAQGGVVGLATETVYGLVAPRLNPRSVARVRRVADGRRIAPADPAPEGSGGGHRLGAADLADWAAGWPGGSGPARSP